MKGLKGFLQFVAVIAALTMAFAIAVAYGGEAPTTQSFIDETASVIVIKVNDKPTELLFISKKGSTAGISAADCGKSANCRALVIGLSQIGRMLTLDLKYGAQI